MNVVLRLMELMLSLCGGLGWVGGVGFAESFSCQLLVRLTWTGLSDWTGV